jgi:hypothetical protein
MFRLACLHAAVAVHVVAQQHVPLAVIESTEGRRERQRFITLSRCQSCKVGQQRSPPSQAAVVWRLSGTAHPDGRHSCDKQTLESCGGMWRKIVGYAACGGDCLHHACVALAWFRKVLKGCCCCSAVSGWLCVVCMCCGAVSSMADGAATVNGRVWCSRACLPAVLWLWTVCSKSNAVWRLHWCLLYEFDFSCSYEQHMHTAVCRPGSCN